MDRRPCEEANITLGSTPNSSPNLTCLCEKQKPAFDLELIDGKEHSNRAAKQLNGQKLTDLCQCLTIAAVLSMMVPSRSSKIPLNSCLSIGALNADSSGSKSIMEVGGDGGGAGGGFVVEPKIIQILNKVSTPVIFNVLS